MAPNNNNQSNRKDFFTASSFATLAGCVGIVYIVKSVLVGVFGWKPELTSFIVSILVAYAGLIVLSKKVDLKNAIVTLFNGFLIYFTLVGGTTYFASISDKTADEGFREKKPLAAAFITPLNQDKNLVKKTVTLGESVQSLDSENKSLKTKNDIYKKDIDSLEADVRKMSPTAAFQKKAILNKISSIKNQISKVPIKK